MRGRCCGSHPARYRDRGQTDEPSREPDPESSPGCLTPRQVFASEAAGNTVLLRDRRHRDLPIAADTLIAVVVPDEIAVLLGEPVLARA